MPTTYEELERKYHRALNTILRRDQTILLQEKEIGDAVKRRTLEIASLLIDFYRAGDDDGWYEPKNAVRAIKEKYPDCFIEEEPCG